MKLALVCLAAAMAPSVECVNSTYTGLIYISPSRQGGTCASASETGLEPCLTIEEMWGNQAGDERWEPRSHSTLVFLRGRHVVNFNRVVVFQDISNLTLTAESEAKLTAGDDDSAILTEIFCAKPSGFWFLNISQLTISHLTFTRCGIDSVGSNLVNKTFHIYANSFFLFKPLERMALTVGSVTNLTISSVTVQNGTGYGLLVVNLFGSSIIENSKFIFNNYHTYFDELCTGTFTLEESFFICAGGNIALAFVDPQECIDKENPPVYSLNITSTLVAYGVSLSPYVVGSGIVAAMSQTAYGMHIYMDNVTSIYNSARNGANMAFLIYDVVDESPISIQNSFSGFSNPLFHPTILMILSGTQFIGGGLLFSYGMSLPTRFTPSCEPKSKHNRADMLTITDTDFVGNNAILGGAVSIHFSQTDIDFGIVAQIVIENCSFRNNIGSPGSALYINQLQPIRNAHLAQFLFKNCNFSNNTYPVSEIPNSIQEFELDLLNSIQLISVQDATFIDCMFQDNLGSALYGYASLLRFNGDICFVRNSGINGGGMSLHGSSVMVLTPNTSVTFLNNSAQFRGGGLFVTSENYRTSLLCFWQLESADFINETGIPIDIVLPINRPNDIVNIADLLNVHVTFRGNTAASAGSAIYGGVIERCVFLATVDLGGSRWSDRIFSKMFSFPDSESDGSLISSDPYRICICNHTVPVCDATNPNATLFPGQTYNIYAVTVGQRNGTSPGVVFAGFIRAQDGEYDAAVLPFESAQQVGQSCTKLSYTILSTQLGVQLQLLLALENSNVQRQPTIVNIQLLPCPPGFFLSKNPPRCECHPFLSQFGIECNITTETVHRVPPRWLSRDLGDSESEHLVLYNYCPFDYCVPDELDHNLSQTNALCASNRVGVICGRCQPGFSLTLGTNECEICTSSYLALLIPFAVAGLLLVFLLLCCSSLTVSVGTINGLIFYANIVQVNRDIFFPPGHINLMTTFIAWLNLDFGIKTCFYDGMDAYSKTFLQFAFPLYVWTIIGVVILLGHYFTSVAKLLGDKGVPVLATIFLLSVAKLQRTIIIGLSYATIISSDGSSTVVWAIDGNIEYLKGKHIYLFVVSLAVLFFIMLPFAFALLFVTCLQALSTHRLFHCVNRSKPLIDAYLGPYKDKHRYWTGFLLFARGAILIIFSQVEPRVTLLVIVVSMQLLSVFTWVDGGVYKKWPLNALEFSFFANLGILSVCTLYVQYSGGFQEGAIYTSITVAFLEFLGIMAYAIFHQLDSYFNWNTSSSCIKEKLSKIFFTSRTRSESTDKENVSVTSSPSNTSKPFLDSDATNLELVVVNRRDTDSMEGSVCVELREPLLESGRYTV